MELVEGGVRVVGGSGGGKTNSLCSGSSRINDSGGSVHVGVAVQVVVVVVAVVVVAGSRIKPEHFHLEKLVVVGCAHEFSSAAVAPLTLSSSLQGKKASCMTEVVNSREIKFVQILHYIFTKKH